jgi:hypothetical protein
MIAELTFAALLACCLLPRLLAAFVIIGLLCVFGTRRAVVFGVVGSFAVLWPALFFGVVVPLAYLLPWHLLLCYQLPSCVAFASVAECSGGGVVSVSLPLPPACGHDFCKRLPAVGLLGSLASNLPIAPALASFDGTIVSASHPLPHACGDGSSWGLSVGLSGFPAVDVSTAPVVDNDIHRKTKVSGFVKSTR